MDSQVKSQNNTLIGFYRGLSPLLVFSVPKVAVRYKTCYHNLNIDLGQTIFFETTYSPKKIDLTHLWQVLEQEQQKR